MKNKTIKKQKEFLNQKEADTLREFIESIEPNCTFMLIKDMGTCITGNGIQIVHRFPRERYSRNRRVYTQRYTQGEQEQFLMYMIERCRKKFPEWSHLIKYDCGRMD